MNADSVDPEAVWINERRDALLDLWRELLEVIVTASARGDDRRLQDASAELFRALSIVANRAYFLQRYALQLASDHDPRVWEALTQLIRRHPLPSD